MAQQTINVSDGENTGEGDTARDAFVKVNANFDELYAGGPSVADAFANVAVDGQDTVAADAAGDTVTFAGGTNVTVTTNSATKTVTIAATGETGYSTVQGDGAEVAQQPTVNFVGTAAVVTDDPSNDRTVVTFDADLNAIADLATFGIMARTAEATYVPRTLTAGSAKVSVANGNGVAGNMTVDIAESELTLTNLGGTLSLAKGGTGAITAAAARVAFGLSETLFPFVIDGGGSAITTGIKVIAFEVPFACTITGWRILADQSGSIVLDVWKDTYANYPPIAADSIAGTEKPTLSAAAKNEDTTLTTWTTALAKGDIIRINVDSAATVTWVYFSLLVTV